MAASNGEEDVVRVPLAAEVATVSTAAVETGRVRITTHVDERQELIRAALRHEDVVVERVAIGDVVPVAPEVRMDGDVLVYPVVEEVLVVEKRLVLKEELRISKRSRVETVEREVTLRSEHADVLRTPVERS